MECSECINNDRNESRAMLEVWKWKEEAGKELLNMTQEERIDHYKKITEEAEKEYGIKLKSKV